MTVQKFLELMGPDRARKISERPRMLRMLSPRKQELLQRFIADNQTSEAPKETHVFPSTSLNRESSEVEIAPPRNAEYILRLILPKANRQTIIGDLIEEYAEVRNRFGQNRADYWFRVQVAFSLWPIIRRLLLKAISLTWIVKLIRRVV